MAVKISFANFTFTSVNSTGKASQILLPCQSDVSCVLRYFELGHITDAEKFGKTCMEKSAVLSRWDRNQHAFQFAPVSADFTNPFSGPTPFNRVTGGGEAGVALPFAVESRAAVEDRCQHVRHQAKNAWAVATHAAAMLV